MKLSLIELATVAPGSDNTQALKDSVDAAKQAEDLGYHRIWYAEHHDSASTASSAPEILIALAAGATSRIRVGSGAVLLNHYSPYRSPNPSSSSKPSHQAASTSASAAPPQAPWSTSPCAATVTYRPPTTSHSRSRKYSPTSTAASPPATPSRA